MPNIRRDRLWKSIIEDCFDEFLQYFYPHAYPHIDRARGYVFLDKELEQILPESQGNDRIADKLAKVYLKDGQEAWFLVHVEVQGYADDDFPWRMFQYFYRILDRYQKPITALALLTYPDAPALPQRYDYEFMDTRLSYAYRSVRLMDQSADAYAADGHIFGLVMAAARATLDRGLGDEALLDFAKNLVMRLFRAGHSKEQIHHVMLFLQCYVRFGKAETKQQFQDFSDQLMFKNRPMGIVELVREHLIEEAKQEGIQQGRQEALEEAAKALEESRAAAAKALEESRAAAAAAKALEENLAAAAKTMLDAGLSEAQVIAAFNIDADTLHRYLAIIDR